MKGLWRQRGGDERKGRNSKEADVEKWLDKGERGERDRVVKLNGTPKKNKAEGPTGAQTASER